MRTKPSHSSQITSLLTMFLFSLIHSCNQKPPLHPLEGATMLDSGATYGNYRVGFEFFEETDPEIDAERPIRFGIWYPHLSEDSSMTLLAYEQVINSTADQDSAYDNFINQTSFLGQLDEDILVENLTVIANANHQADYLNQKFPVVIYSSKSHAPVHENWLLFEFLASHGYVVIAVPPRREEDPTYNMVAANLNDIRFAVSHLENECECLDLDKVITAGYEIGGIAAIAYLIENENTLGHLSLNGAVGSNFGWTFARGIKSLTFNKIDKPILHVGTSNYFLDDESFETLDSLNKSDAHYVFLDKSAPIGVSAYYTFHWTQSVQSIEHNMKIDKEANYRNYDLLLQSSLNFCDLMTGKMDKQAFVDFVAQSHSRSYSKY